MKLDTQAMPLLGPAARYVVKRRLGEGAFGAVDAVVDVESGQELALKALTRAQPAALARFKHEFRALADLHHPNLVGLRALFEQDGEWLIAMDLIEGDDLLHWVRPDPASAYFDEARLRASFAGIAEGLGALHARGMLHRDLKPSNVRVTPEGRAVLLDFGLVTSFDAGGPSTMGGATGTAAYMAPEQATGSKIGPQADWYAFGACLYEALTGALPFAGETMFNLLLRKQRERPRPPRELAPGVPYDLDGLCMALLDPSPVSRAGARAVARMLTPSETSRGIASVMPSMAPSLGPEAAFEGREVELEELRQALARSHDGAISVVLVAGESGVGKSALVREMLRRQRERDPSTWALEGRCYEHEQVPYKAFDGCFDALARGLSKLDAETCAALLPRRAGLVAQLFPVLGGVPSIARASTEGAPAEPLARRLHAFAVVGSLLGRLAEQRPVILTIDDLQWADQESFRLLRALVEHRDPPPVTIVGTVRPDSELSHELVKSIDMLRGFKCARSIALRGLPPVQAHSLVQRLLGEGTPSTRTKKIALESMGNPLLISELVQYAVSHASDADGAFTLWSALSARISALAPDARTLLEQVALCARPRSEMFFERLHGDKARFGLVLTLLLAQKLLTRKRGGQLACFHDRIRTATVDGVSTGRLPVLHFDIANALESESQVDPGELAYHWDAAGERTRALAAYTRAADQALEILAFTRAAQLYGRALELTTDTSDGEALRLLVQRGHALARAGRSAEAAKLFVKASERAEGDERVRLRISAAQHQIQSAAASEGAESARSVLEDLGISLPRGLTASIARMGWERARLKLRGVAVSPTQNTVSARARLELDAMEQLALPLGWVDVLPGSVLNMIYLRRALSVGDRGHVAHALAAEAAFRAMQAPARVDDYLPLCERSRALAEGGEPALQAHVEFLVGSAAFFRCELALAELCFDTAHTLLSTRCPGEAWLLTNVRMNLGALWLTLGRYSKLANDLPVWIAEAKERQDRFALAALAGLGLGGTSFLINDDPDAARELLTSAMTVWPAESFTLAHHGELIATTLIETYRGGEGAHRWLLDRTRIHDGSFLHRTHLLGSSLRLMRANAALCAAAQATPAARPALLDFAERSLGGLDARVTGWVGAAAQATQAQVFAARGDQGRAVRDLASARTRFAAHGMGGYVASVSYLQGLIEGGERGQELRESALQYFAGHAWKDPWRAAAMNVPIIGLLESGAAHAPGAQRLIHGRYQVGRSLGRAGLGAIHEALDTRTGRTVALKSLEHATPEDLLRLKREFRALQTLHHENLVRLETLFEQDGNCTIAMERVEGTDFVSYVREGKTFDEGRLRRALSGLLAGVGALHEAGFLHRDLNPKNVRVTPEGRVVLVDFGLMTTIEATDREKTSPGLGGLIYVAPEQADQDDFDAAADVYSVGACLYTALTGQPPFDHLTIDRLLDAKRRGRPIPPTAMRIQVPEDLEKLCLQMLEREPRRRPSVAEALARLEHPGADPGSAFTSLHPRSRRDGPSSAFAGRAAELAALESAFVRSEAGTATLVLVEGESGLGKTALLGEFLRRLTHRDADVVVLRSRCYANEQIAYQAFDAAIDELARLLRKLPREECEAMLPPKAALLAQIFPVLASVSAISNAGKKGLPADPITRRRDALTAFVTLLGRVCQRFSVVIAIDDIQWADLESFALLRALFDGSASTRPLIVASRRKGEARVAAVERELETLSCARATQILTLGPLSNAEAEGLTASLLGPSVSAERARALVRESGGHPLFLRELSAYAAAGGDVLLEGTFDLDQALATRFDRLPREARRLLDLVALAARPLPAQVFERAFDDAEHYQTASRGLMREELLRARSGDELVCYHDRVREVLLRRMSPDLTRSLSERLARALDAEPDSDAGERARLWEQAGKVVLACAAYGEAGDAALEVLAFARADESYLRALALKGEIRDAEYAHLLTQRGHALARQGQSAAAADLYFMAAQHSEGERRVRLRVWATLHQLKSAQLEQGLKSARSVLQDVGMPLPEGTPSALAHIGWSRAILSVRGLGVTVSDAAQVSDAARLRLDTVWDLAFPVVWADMLSGASLNVRHLRESLSLGEPGHVARALAQEAAFVTMQKPSDTRRSAELFARARGLVDAASDPKLSAFIDFIEGSAAQFRWDFAASRFFLERAETVCNEQCPDEPWLLTNTRMGLASVWFNLGEHAKLAAMCASWMDDARGREDRFGLAALAGLGQGFERHLMHDVPDVARQELADVMAPWPREPFSFAQFGEVFGVINTELYRGGDGAQRWLEQESQRLERAFLIRSKFGRATHWVMRSLATLAAWVSSEGPERARLCKSLRTQVRGLARHAVPIAEALGPLVSAQLLVIEGSTAEALSATRVARQKLEVDGLFYHHAASYLEGVLEGGDPGAERCRGALHYFKSQGWRNPRRAVAMWVPIVDHLEGRSR